MHVKVAFHYQKGEDREGRTANPSEHVIQPQVLHTQIVCRDIESHMVNGHGDYRNDFQRTATECYFSSLESHFI